LIISINITNGKRWRILVLERGAIKVPVYSIYG